MIPKKIHYCWLSQEDYPESIKKCIASWHKYMPDYEFILWDAKRFDINSVKYVKQAYEAKKYAFASDYIRLYALYNYGGIYLDSDIEVFKSFDALLNNKAFTGYEDGEKVAAWIFGSEARNPLFEEFIEYYRDRDFIFQNGSYNMVPNVIPITDTLKRHGLRCDNQKQNLENITIYPRDYFCPFLPNNKLDDCYTNNTYCQHLFNGGWIDKKHRIILSRKHSLEKRYGSLIGKIYYAVSLIKEDGYEAMISQAISK